MFLIKLQKKYVKMFNQTIILGQIKRSNPIRYAINPAIQATAIVLNIESNAHFHVPVSFLIVYAVATQGI